MRGELTEEIQTEAKRFLNREIDTIELRLYPYIDFCIKNGGYYDRSKISGEERQILSKLKDEGHLEMNGCFYVTLKFYDYMNRVLWLSYVETKKDE